MNKEKDYISREAALNACCENCLAANDCRPGERCADYMRLKELPAADVRPVVRGKWTDHRAIGHDGEWYCTACGKEITIYMGEDRADRYNYCPNCGADMRKEN